MDDFDKFYEREKALKNWIGELKKLPVSNDQDKPITERRWHVWNPVKQKYEKHH